MGIPPIGEALLDAGLGTKIKYITCRYNIVAQYTTTRQFFVIVMTEERRTGYMVIIRW